MGWLLWKGYEIQSLKFVLRDCQLKNWETFGNFKLQWSWQNSYYKIQGSSKSFHQSVIQLIKIWFSETFKIAQISQNGWFEKTDSIFGHVSFHFITHWHHFWNLFDVTFFGHEMFDEIYFVVKTNCSIHLSFHPEYNSTKHLQTKQNLCSCLNERK